MSGKLQNTSKPQNTDSLAQINNHTEKNRLKLFRMEIGIPSGPVDFFISNASMIFSTSPGTVGERKKDELTGIYIYFIILLFYTKRTIISTGLKMIFFLFYL